MRISPLLLALTAVVISGSASAQNLVNNGSFESPVQADRGYTDYVVGSSDITGWSIVGTRGTYVSLVNRNYDQNPGFSFPAQDGIQWLDLAGYSDNAPDGLQQSIATAIGASYLLSFYVGNVTGGPNNAFGSQSSVGVEFSSGGNDFRCTNTAAGMTLSWQLCSQQFVATDTLTTFTLRNLDPTSDFSNAVDNVSFTLVTPSSAVPEPDSWALMIGGFGAIGGALRGRRLRNLVKQRAAA